MKTALKQTIATTVGAVTTLSLATQAFAQTELNPCVNLSAPWNALCDINTTNLPTVLGNIILILFIGAALIALFFLIWGGIKWILSGGDKGKVETARGTIIAAIIGLAITFLAFFLLQFILGIFGLSITNLTIPTLTGTP